MFGSSVRRLVLVIGLLLVVTLVWTRVWRFKTGQLVVAFLDVGQGDAIYIESPTGRQVLVDGGAGGAVLRELGQVMPWFDRSLDLVIASHPDADHVGGLIDVFKRYQVAGFMESGVESDNRLDDNLRDLVEREPATLLLARRGQVVELGGGARLEILFPDRDPSGWETNEASIVARLVYGQHEFLLTGDAPLSVERRLLAAPETLGADVLKAGHHGSRTSTGDDWLAAVNPDWTIISAGAKNRYGHPHPELLARVAKTSSTVVKTVERGTIVFKTDGRELRYLNR